MDKDLSKKLSSGTAEKASTGKDSKPVKTSHDAISDYSDDWGEDSP